MAQMTQIYGNDVDVAVLPTELAILQTLTKETNPQHAADLFTVMRSLRKETLLIPNVIKILKLLLVNGATSATPERSFSTARRLKTWLRSTMSQKRFNTLAILNTHKELTDKICFVKVGNIFVESQSKRYNHFGKFLQEDID